jgi:thymidylate kinase
MSRTVRRIQTIVVCGPDGSGKTTLARELASGSAGRQILWLHHRPGVLPKRSASEGPVLEPHRLPPYGRIASYLKLAYLFADYSLGWFLRVRPVLRRGGLLILERGWWDLSVDPRRYRLQDISRAVRFLGAFLPSPDLVLLLEAPPDVLLARKAELPGNELARQVYTWRQALSPKSHTVILDASAPREEVVQRAIRLVEQRPAVPPASGVLPDWVNLPMGSEPRWFLRSGPGRTASESLRVYHPITWKGLLGWRIARLFAKAGGFRFLPRGAPPPQSVLDSIPSHLKTRRCLAVARTNHPGRFVALIESGTAGGALVAKIATTEQGKTSLVREAAAVAEVAKLLPKRLHAPRITHSQSGIVIFEFVPWVARLRPWRLPPDVAAALGILFRSGGPSSDVGRGYVHGDCAPWNLYKTKNGWFLCDWESARPDGHPFDDVFHFVIQAHALLGRPSRSAVLAGLHGRGWVGRALLAYAGAAGLNLRDAPEALRAYLERSQTDLSVDKSDERRGIEVRQFLAKVLGTMRSV